MKPRSFDVRRLDVKAFAKSAGACEGHWPLADFERLRDVLVLPGDASPLPDVHWSVRGEERPVSAGPAEIWLHLSVQAVLPLPCQRCLQRFDHEVRFERPFQFVADEAVAADLDGEVEHDVLVLARELDLRALLEDELLLDLPLVPRHEECPLPLPMSAAPTSDEPHPFAALEALRRSGR